ncbi:MAG TPA: transporter substrate-binding domain-containing protein, partial [Mycobacterium sp.]|nr:transporter substrate-binding domain-containing protein [Mycobacterium sp.]
MANSVRRWIRMFGILLMVAVFAGLPAAGAQTRTVNVAVHELEPMVMKTDDGRHTGFAVDVWQGIAERNQWTTNYVEFEDAAAELDAVAQNKADVAIGGISITAERTPKFDFTQPTMNGGLQIMVPMKSIGPAQLGILPFLKLLFSKTILIWLLAGLAISLVPALLMWLLESHWFARRLGLLDFDQGL